MNTKKLIEIRNDIQTLATKHNIKDWAFCGAEKNNSQFIGTMEEKRTQGAAMLTIINVGRLWQWARECNRILLNSYEKLP